MALRPVESKIFHPLHPLRRARPYRLGVFGRFVRISVGSLSRHSAVLNALHA